MLHLEVDETPSLGTLVEYFPDGRVHSAIFRTVLLESKPDVEIGEFFLESIRTAKERDDCLEGCLSATQHFVECVTENLRRESLDTRQSFVARISLKLSGNDVIPQQRKVRSLGQQTGLELDSDKLVTTVTVSDFHV